MSKVEPGKLKVKEAFLTRYLAGDDDTKQGVALAFVLTLRSNAAEARTKSDVALRAEFDEWLWDVEQEDVIAIIEEHGFGAEDSDEEAKKD